MDSESALLVIFGDLILAGRRLRGRTIFEELIAEGLWIASRVPKYLRPGSPALFYEKGVGVRGAAIVESVEKRNAADAALLGLPASLYPLRLNLNAAEIFAQPIDLRPLVRSLSFISNKEYWGHSIRLSPRLIPIADFHMIHALRERR